MMQEPERRVDHVTGARGDLGAATKTGKIVADVAVVLLDREGQILAGEELLRRGLAGRAQPPVDRDVADAQELGDHALAGVAHGVEQDRQGLHGLGFAALRRGGEVAAAGLAEVALVAPYRAVLDERRPGAPLAAHLDQPCPPDPAVELSYQAVDLWVNVSFFERLLLFRRGPRRMLRPRRLDRPADRPQRLPAALDRHRGEPQLPRHPR